MKKLFFLGKHCLNFCLIFLTQLTFQHPLFSLRHQIKLFLGYHVFTYIAIICSSSVIMVFSMSKEMSILV